MIAPTARSCAHCEELREEIRFLKRERDIEREKAFVDRLKVHLRITPGDALVLAALYRANGRCLSIAHLDEVVPHLSAGDDRNMKHVDIRVSRIRKALGKASVENVRGSGYFLTALGRLQIDEVLEVQKARAA